MAGVDVVVAGGGPGGCAAAIALARAGRRVLLADSPRAPRARGLKIGETLPAVAATILRDLGVLEAFERAAIATPSTGTSTVWGGPAALEAHAIADPLGPGWHLDRALFDTWLREQAGLAGAEICCARARARAQRSRSRAGPSRGERRDDDDAPLWHVELGAPCLREVGCRRLIDATGRGASVARAQGAARERHDRLVAVYARLRTPPGDVDRRTRVASTRDGWWYSALVGPRRRVVAFLTDADLLDPALRGPTGFAAALAARGAHVLATTGAVMDQLESGPVATAARSARLVPPCQAGWLAVGDAALAFDPLSSQGILNALVTGRLAADAVDADLDGAAAALPSYARRLDDVWASYESRLREAYALEGRWPDAPFWARRSGDRAARPARRG